MATTTDLIPFELRFPDTDDVPLESAWHRDQVNFLVELLDSRFHGREDYVVAGNMFIYYDETNARKSAGPDVFLVKGINRLPKRNIWAVWKEQGRFPDVIIELMSPRTKNKDRKTNKDLYERVFQTPEYFMYDPQTQTLEGWRLIDGRYEPIAPNQADGRFWSDQLDCWLGLHEGEYWPGNSDLWVRLFDRQGKLIPSFRERSDEREQRAKEREKRAKEREKLAKESEKRQRERADEQQRRAEEQRRWAEEQRRRAEEERRHREETERQLAEKARQLEEERKQAKEAQAELARLRALLKQPDPDEPNDK